MWQLENSSHAFGQIAIRIKSKLVSKVLEQVVKQLKFVLHPNSKHTKLKSTLIRLNSFSLVGFVAHAIVQCSDSWYLNQCAQERCCWKFLFDLNFYINSEILVLYLHLMAAYIFNISSVLCAYAVCTLVNSYCIRSSGYTSHARLAINIEFWGIRAKLQCKYLFCSGCLNAAFGNVFILKTWRMPLKGRELKASFFKASSILPSVFTLQAPLFVLHIFAQIDLTFCSARLFCNIWHFSIEICSIKKKSITVASLVYGSVHSFKCFKFRWWMTFVSVCSCHLNTLETLFVYVKIAIVSVSVSLSRSRINFSEWFRF